MRIVVFVLLGLLAGCNTARAQSAFGNNPTVGTSPAQVLPQSNARRRVIFHNPSPTATIACCPASTRGGTPITCAVSGAGSLTLLPRDFFVMDGAGSQPGVPMAWNCVSDTPATPFTTFEFE